MEDTSYYLKSMKLLDLRLNNSNFCLRHCKWKNFANSIKGDFDG